MNIAIFTDTFIPQHDGIVTSTISLVKGLADNGHKIYIIAPKYKNTKEFSYKNVVVLRISGIPALFYPGFKFTSIFSYKIMKKLKKEKIDLIHFLTPFTIGLQGILIAKKLKKPLVGTFHTFITDEQYIRHSGISLKFIQKILQKISWGYIRAYYNSCDLITSPSEGTKKELIENNLKKPIEVISNGINFSIFDNSNWKKAKKKYNINDKTILFVGRIAYEKNIKYLLDCFKLVINKIPDAKLLIVGDGPQMDQLKKDILKMKLSKNVILTGKIEHKKLLTSGIFKACKIFATASITENQPMTLLEAQANGLACVGMNVRGINDLIKDNYNGLLAKKGDKKEFAEHIIKLLIDEKFYNLMRKNTFNEIKKHDIKKTINLWEKKYISIIDENDK